MSTAVSIRIVLVDPPAGVDFGLQRGRGAKYETFAVERSSHGDLSFDCPLTIANTRRDGRPKFVGPFAQGSPADRFVYIDVGTYAGQKDTPWSRRIKIPLKGITWDLIEQAAAKPGSSLVVSIAGTGRDGGPACATVPLLEQWHVVTSSRQPAGRYSSEDLHRSVFSTPPARRTLAELREGIRRDIRRRRGRR